MAVNAVSAQQAKVPVVVRDDIGAQIATGQSPQYGVKQDLESDAGHDRMQESKCHTALSRGSDGRFPLYGWLVA